MTFIGLFVKRTDYYIRSVFVIIKRMKNIIVSYSRERGIGAKDDLLWQRDLPADLRHFKEVTTGNAIIMGRVTFFSDLKERLLPNRQSIIVTHQDLAVPGATVVHSLEAAYQAVEEGREPFVIGGEQMFRQAIGESDRMYVTEVDASVPADTFFPDFDKDEWQEVSREHHQADERDLYNYDFVVYERR